MNQDNIDKLKLISGMPICIDNIPVPPLKVKDIAEYGEINYYLALRTICFYLDEILNIDEIKQQYKDICEFDLICSMCTNSEQLDIVNKSFSFLLKTQIVFVKEYCVFASDEYIIDKNKFQKIIPIVRLLNNYTKTEKESYNPANQRAKELLEQIKKNRQNSPQPKAIVDLSSIISGVAWKSGVGFDYVLNLTIYQLYDAYKRLELVDNINHTLTGVYAGTIDQKKIDMKTLMWVKKFD
jgi:hypothetical protein